MTVLRSATGPLTEGEMVLRFSGEDGGSLSFTFLAKPIEPVQGMGRAAEHFGI